MMMRISLVINARFHFPFPICHLSFVIGSVMERRTFNDKWKMTNDKWKIVFLRSRERNIDRNDRPLSRRGLDFISAAEHAHALGDADQAETALASIGSRG